MNKKEVEQQVKEDVIGKVSGETFFVNETSKYFLVTIFASRSGRYKNFLPSTTFNGMLRFGYRLNSVAYRRDKGIQALWLKKKEGEEQ